MLSFLLLFAALFLAYANGANDNFNGVATLYGSKKVGYKTAIILATAATFLGSLCAIFLAQGLIANFSGKGLVPQDIAGSDVFLIAIGLGAGFTVLSATYLGFPISTTHSLLGSLLGAGIMAVGLDVNFYPIGNLFFVPLFIGPCIAFALGICVYMAFTKVSKVFTFSKESSEPVNTIKNTKSSKATITIIDRRERPKPNKNKIWGMPVQNLLNSVHIISAITVSFARGLNVMPKIACLLVTVQTFNIYYGMTAIAIGIAIGGLLSASQVAETMSKKITQITYRQGLSANLVTSFLVIVASKFGVPVSTTHISVSAIFGAGMMDGNMNNQLIRKIIFSWLVTLPAAMWFGACFYSIVGQLNV